MGPPHAPAMRAWLLLCVAAALAGCTEEPAKGVTVEILDRTYAPEALTVANGTSVRFVNVDDEGHAVTVVASGTPDAIMDEHRVRPIRGRGLRRRGRIRRVLPLPRRPRERPAHGRPRTLRNLEKATWRLKRMRPLAVLVLAALTAFPVVAGDVSAYRDYVGGCRDYLELDTSLVVGCEGDLGTPRVALGGAVEDFVRVAVTSGEACGSDACVEGLVALFGQHDVALVYEASADGVVSERIEHLPQARGPLATFVAFGDAHWGVDSLTVSILIDGEVLATDTG